MEDDLEVCVLRVGHRPGRDERMTTHVGLTARALGADRVLFPPEAAGARDAVADVTDRFGGRFEAAITETPRATVEGWSGPVAHLTMYGIPFQRRLEAVRSRGAAAPLLVVVGAEKVPFDLYEAADWNLAVTNQPHSEVGALAVFLERLFGGIASDREWPGADRRVVPREAGKLVEPVEDRPP